MLKTSFAVILSACLAFNQAQAQAIDTLDISAPTIHLNVAPSTPTSLNTRRNNIRSLVVPAAFIGYGFLSLNNPTLKSLDNHIKDEIWTEDPHKSVKIDNYLQYAPAIAVYGLDLIGIKGKNNFRDRSLMYLMSNAMMGITVQSLKAITKVQRPDGYGTNAFPSGHTATAFVAAEFLHQEYKDRSPWYGIGGYAVAATTAYLRMYNNKHWFRDLLPGAGIGILSTKAAYWLYPTIKKHIFKNKDANTMITPYYQHKEAGLAMVRYF